MENLKSLEIPYESYLYTQRKLTASSEKLLAEHAEQLDRTGDAPPLSSVQVRSNSFWTQPVQEVESYRKLLELVAQIAALNPQYQLFFRGQTNNWIGGGFDTTLYSGIWRDPLSSKSLSARCAALNDASDAFQKAYARYYAKDPAAKLFLKRLKQNPLVRWALLQHYGVCETPLLDVTRNLLVACTFARMGAASGHGYVYVLALPYLREAISIDDGEGMAVMSLLGVTPPSARRPLNQDGFLVSTSEWWRYKASETTSDAPGTGDRPNYYKRVIIAFRIPTSDSFYEGSGLSDLSNEWLCPIEDEFAHMLQQTGFEPDFW